MLYLLCVSFPFLAEVLLQLTITCYVNLKKSVSFSLNYYKKNVDVLSTIELYNTGHLKKKPYTWFVICKTIINVWYWQLNTQVYFWFSGHFSACVKGRLINILFCFRNVLYKYIQWTAFNNDILNNILSTLSSLLISCYY